MEIIVLCITVGVLLAAAFVGIGVIIANVNERISEKRDNSGHDSMDIYNNRTDSNNNSSVGDVHEPIDCGQDLELDGEAEAAVIRLNSIRAESTHSEQEAIDYAIESICIRVRLEKFFEERGI